MIPKLILASLIATNSYKETRLDPLIRAPLIDRHAVIAASASLPYSYSEVRVNGKLITCCVCGKPAVSSYTLNERTVGYCREHWRAPKT